MSGVSGIKAGKAFVLIEAIDATGRVLNAVRNKLGKFGTELSNIGRTMALRAIGALTPAALAVKTGTTYDDIMRKVEARSEGTAKEMDNLRDQTLKLGRALGLLPSAMGAGQNVFAQAGFNRKDIALIVPEVTKLARATGDSADQMENMKQASDAVTAVLRAFHLNATDAAEVANKIGITAVSSSFGLEGITTSLSHAASAASTYGISIDEMLATMAAMKDIQIEDSIVGTAFRNMMGYMSQKDEQDKFNQRLQEMTGNTIQFTDAVGNLYGPMKLLPALLKATEGIGSAERMNLLFGLLETRAVIPAIAAGSSVGRMADVMDRLENWRGFNDKLQKQMDAGLGGAFRRFAATLEGTAIKFQNALAPALSTTTAAFDMLLGQVTDWIIANPGLVSSVVAVGVGFLALGTAMVVAGQSLIAISALFGLGATLTSITSYLIAFVAPWAAAAAGIYLAADALGLLPQKVPNIQISLGSLGDTIKRVGSEWSTTFTSIASSLATGDIASAFNTLSGQLQLTWTELINHLMGKWDDFMQLLADTKSQAGSIYLNYLEMEQSINDFMTKTVGLPDRGYGQLLKDKIAATKATLEGLYAETQNTPEAQARRARKNEGASELRRLRLSHEADLAIAEAHRVLAEYERSKAKTDTAVVEADVRKRKMEAEAAGLIVPGAVVPGTPKSAVDAIESTSKEAMRAFQEAKYDSFEAALDIAGKIGEDVGIIRKKVEEGGSIGVL